MGVSAWCTGGIGGNHTHSPHTTIIPTHIFSNKIRKEESNYRERQFDISYEVTMKHDKLNHQWTREEALEAQKKAVEARRRNKEERLALKKTLSCILSKSVKKGLMVDANDFLSIAEMNNKNISVQDAVMLAQVQKALLGDTQSAVFIRDTLGEKPVEKVEASMSIEDYVKNHKVKF